MMSPTTRRRLRLLRLGVSAWLGLLMFDLTARSGLARLHASLGAYGVRSRGRAPQSAAPRPDDVVWAVEEACVWYVRRAMCLQRSAVTTWLLRRHGVAAELVIGYRPVPFESHAWVEVAGRVVNDRPQYQKAFIVLERL